MAFHLTDVVSAFVQRARRLYYAVMLMGHACPDCDGALVMVGESRCRCRACGRTLDPTVAFQRCSACGGRPVLRIRRYQCSRCREDVPSRFVFQGLVFDAEYFRERMAEFRKRKQAERERLQERVVEDRSNVLDPPVADLESVPGLVDALNNLSLGPELCAWVPLQNGFDLGRYQRHLLAHVGLIQVCFEDLPPLEDNYRLDRIWRFVALIFMDHAGLIQIYQEGRTIWVKQHETD